MAVDSEKLKELRELTGAGMMDCKKALEQAGGNRDKAVQILQKLGYEKADKLVGKEAKAGRIEAYIHSTENAKGRIGCLVELTCQTDFVAKHPEFEELLRDICLQVAGMKPTAISREDLPKERVEAERRRFAAEVTGKPPEIVARIVEGKLEKNLYAQECLLDQPFVNEAKFKGKVIDLLKQKSGKFGENIAVRRFARFEVNSSTLVCDTVKTQAEAP